MSEKIIDVNVLNQHNLDMQRYGLYISRFRSLPEYRDGLKPVQRRIMYGAYKKGFRKPSQHGKYCLQCSKTCTLLKIIELNVLKL